MDLAEPPAVLRRGTALPGGAPRTLIVLGAERGGTSMVAQILRELGAFMGEALDSTCQDGTMSGICTALFHREIDIEHPAIEQVLRQRDRQFDIWGWKFPGHVFEPLYEKARNPHIVAVFRDPVATATRESVSKGYNLEMCFNNASRQISALGRFVASTSHPCIAVSYERGVAKKAELIDALADFAGVAAAHEARQRAARQIEQGSSRYLDDTRASDIEGTIDCVDGHIGGWLRYPYRPQRRVAFTIVVDEVPIYRGVADRFRADLLKAFNNDGCCSFLVPTPQNLKDGKPHRVSIQIPDEANCLVVNNDREWTIADR